MSQLNGYQGNLSPLNEGKNNLGSCHSQTFPPKSSANVFEDENFPLKSLLASHCTREFENLQDYLLEVAKVLGERRPFYAIDLADILRKVQKWKNMLPNVEIFYAVKVNSDPVLLKFLVTIGTSFDCATEGEIEAVLKAGASPSSILWAHTIKPVEGLLYARKMGVDAMTFDDEEELKKIRKVFPTARLLLRVRPSMVKCKYDLSTKFGCSMVQAEYLLRLAKQLDMNVIGISFHVGALCPDPECFSSTIRDCRDIFLQARQMGCPMSVLDIGGGFFGATGTETIFKEITEGINQALDEHFRDLQVKVIAEPGCYMAASAGDLVCTVIGKKNLKEADGIHKHYFVNESIYGSFFRNIEWYDVHVKPLLSEFERMNRPVFETKIYGQTCCCEDVLLRSGRLPELEVGECVSWDNTGAYCLAVCSTFCGVPLPATVYVFNQSEESESNKIQLNDTVREFLAKEAIFIGVSSEISK